MKQQRWTTVWGGFPFALAAVALATGALFALRPILDPPQVMLLYVTAVVIVARLTGRLPAVAAALVAFLALDLLFLQPYYRLSVSRPDEWVSLLVFLAAAAIAAAQTGEIRERERTAVRRQTELAVLARLSARLVSEKSVEAMASFIVAEVVGVLEADRAAVYERGSREAVLLAEAGRASSGLAERALASWVAASGTAIEPPGEGGAPIDPGLPAVGPAAAIEGVVADGIYLPLRTKDGLEGVLYARPLPDREFARDQAPRLLAVSNLAAAVLERRRLEAEASRVAAMRDADRLKTTLVSSVSHELKTPLAAVTARVSGMLEEGDSLDVARAREELTAVSEDLVRLDASIRDLLDFSRLESDSWKPRFEEYGVAEVLGTVASRIPAERRPRVVFSVPEGLPAVRLDFAQWARALSNLIDNALTYSPPDAPVTVGARVLGDDLLVWVEDRGPGVPDAEKESVFEKFYRGTASGVSASGTGLGLAITAEIARAHRGRVWVEDAAPNGARFVISLPLGGGDR